MVIDPTRVGASLTYMFELGVLDPATTYVAVVSDFVDDTNQIVQSM